MGEKEDHVFVCPMKIGKTSSRHLPGFGGKTIGIKASIRSGREGLGVHGVSDAAGENSLRASTRDAIFQKVEKKTTSLENLVN